MQQSQIIWRSAVFGVLLMCAACNVTPAPPAPLNLTPEQQKVVDLAQAFLKKIGRDDWGNPIEVKPPPNGRGYLKHRGEEEHTWLVGYPTDDNEMQTVGRRDLFVNIQTNEVSQRSRK
jgi:hypothetical protein